MSWPHTNRVPENSVPRVPQVSRFWGPGKSDPRVPPVRRFWGPGNSSRYRPLLGPALILFAAFVAILPQLIRGNSCGHDFDFHLVSWFDCLSAWKHGLVYPHWTPSPNYGAGEPRFVFYPPLTWMLGAALGAILPWSLAPIAFTFLCLAGTGLATRALAAQTLNLTASDDAIPTLAGCAALFSGYSLFTAYERTAFGELAGGFWIPLLLLFILRERNPSAPLIRRAFDGSAVPLALAVAGAWLSNAPLGVMASYLLAAVALAAAISEKSWAPILRAAVAAVLGIGLAALYLVPAAFEQRWVDIRQAIDDPASMIEGSWLFARHAGPDMLNHDIELHRVSLLAVSMLAVAVVGLLIFWLRGRLTGPRRGWIPLALIPFAILFLLLPVSLPVWNLLPRLRYLQFPWRWLVALEAPMAIFFALAVWPRSAARRLSRFAVIAVCATFFLAASVFAARNFFQTCDTEDAVWAMLSTYRAQTGFLGSGEYSPPGSDNATVATGLPDACLVNDPDTVLGILDTPGANPDWWVEQGSCSATFNWQPGLPERKRLQAVTSHAGFLILRLTAYPAWRITLNGRRVDSLPQRDDGLIAVPVPQGPVDLAVDFATTPDVIAGRCLSAISLLLLTILWLIEQRPTRPQLS